MEPFDVTENTFAFRPHTEQLPKPELGEGVLISSSPARIQFEHSPKVAVRESSCPQLLHLGGGVDSRYGTTDGNARTSARREGISHLVSCASWVNLFVVSMWRISISVLISFTRKIALRTLAPSGRSSLKTPTSRSLRQSSSMRAESFHSDR
jgi:hypothetical protein